MVSSKGEVNHVKTTYSTMPTTTTGTLRQRQRWLLTLHMSQYLKDANKIERVCYNRMVRTTEQRCECAPRNTRYAEPAARYAEPAARYAESAARYAKPAARYAEPTRGKQGRRCDYGKLSRKKKRIGKAE